MWEHLVIRGEDRGNWLETQLDGAGADGWQLVSTSIDGDMMYLFFKRPKK